MSDAELTPDEIEKIIVEATRAKETGWRGNSAITELFGRALLQTRRQLEQADAVIARQSVKNGVVRLDNPDYHAIMEASTRHAQAAMKEKK